MSTVSCARNLGLALFVSAALGAVSVARADAVLEEILVTASKRGEVSLQDTAISVSAVSADTIEKSRILNLESMQAYVPNLVVGDSSDTPGDAVVSIRGIGAQILSAGADPSVSVHVDGVYNSRPATAFAELLDVERVEVLRGPQGTLYGRNSVGGTINVIHKEPVESTEMSIVGEIGNLDTYRTIFGVNGTLIDDRLFGRIAVSRRANGGWLHNVLDGKDYGAKTATAVRGAGKVLIADNSDLVLRFDYASFSGDGRPGKLLGVGEDPDDPTLTTQPPINASPDPGGWYDINMNTLPSTPFRKQRDWGVSALLTFDLGDYALSSLTAHRSHTTDFINDTDLTSAVILQDTISSESKLVSEELRLLSKFDSRLNFQISALYMRDEADLDIFSNFNPLETEAGGAFLAIGENQLIVPLVQNNVTKALAIFGELYVDISDQWRLTVGGRYSSEEKTLIDQTVPGFVFIPAGTPVVYELDRLKSTRDWDDFTSKFTLEYKPNDELLVYANYSEGFKSGGFNLRFGQPESTPFEPEAVKSYELGVKNTWLSGGLRTNLALFHMDYTDQQIQIVTNTDETGGVTEVDTVNAGASQYRGAELEVQALLTDSLTLGTAIGYLDAEFKTFSTQQTGNISGFTPRDAPEWTVSVYGDYVLAVGGANELLLHVDGSWRDDNVQRPSAVSYNQHVIDSYFLANARVTYALNDDAWSISLWGNNLFDEEYAITKFDQPFGVSQIYHGMTRTFGVSVQVNF